MNMINTRPRFYHFYIFFFAVLGCNKDKAVVAPTRDFSFNGNVKSEKEAVSEANVRLVKDESNSTVTDRNGYFQLDNLPEGDHSIRIEKKYKDGSMVSKTVSGNTSNSTDTFLLPKPLQLNLVIQQKKFDQEEIQLSWNKAGPSDFYEYKIYSHTSAALDETTGGLLTI